MDTVSALLEAGADINALDRNKSAAIVEAVKNGRLDVTRFLLERKADPNEGLQSMDVRSPLLIMAVREMNPEMVKLLIRSGADVNLRTEDGFSALHAAVSRNFVGIDTNDEKMKKRREILEALLVAKADPHVKNAQGRTPLESAQKNEDQEAANLLRKFTEKKP
jgi:ankyrin repeat protein